MAAYWRIRLKNATGNDYSEDAWPRNQVGLWYGAWTAQDFETARSRSSTNTDITERLNDLPAEHDLGWTVVHKILSEIAARRFDDIYLRQIGSYYTFAVFKRSGSRGYTVQLCSNANHPFNSNGELFKYREIVHKKTFSMANLPDAYRLLPTPGEGKYSTFNNTWPMHRIWAAVRA